MIRTQIYLPEELLMQIKLEAQIQGIKMSELIRQALETGLKNQSKTKTKKNGLISMIGKYKTNSNPNSATDHNSIYQNFNS